MNGLKILIAISSYLFGSAVGVHWIAKLENPSLSFPGAGVFVIALCPIISSMVYASCISGWQQENPKVFFIKNSIYHKNLVEQTKMFDIELSHIKL